MTRSQPRSLAQWQQYMLKIEAQLARIAFVYQLAPEPLMCIKCLLEDLLTESIIPSFFSSPEKLVEKTALPAHQNQVQNLGVYKGIYHKPLANESGEICHQVLPPCRDIVPGSQEICRAIRRCNICKRPHEIISWYRRKFTGKVAYKDNKANLWK